MSALQFTLSDDDVERIAAKVVAKMNATATAPLVTLATLPESMKPLRRPIADALSRQEIDGAALIGKRWVFRLDAVTAWVESRAVQPSAANEDGYARALSLVRAKAAR